MFNFKIKYNLNIIGIIYRALFATELKMNCDINQVKSRACIRTTLISDPGLILIKNRGGCDAKNVKIVLDGIPIYRYPGILIKKESYTIPAGSILSIQACMNTDLFPSESIEVSWDDEESDDNTYRIPLYV
jgi:hypothetical protein